MPSGFWDYIHLGRSHTNDNEDEQGHNLQEGLFQIATQTCNILVQVNNTNNINLGFDDFEVKKSENYGGGGGGESSKASRQKTLFDLEQSVVLLQPKGNNLSPSTPTKVRFSRLSEYKRRLSVSHNQHYLLKLLVSYIIFSWVDYFFMTFILLFCKKDQIYSNIPTIIKSVQHLTLSKQMNKKRQFLSLHATTS